jgi:diguanylate cyclase (GGDEF)-like protein
MELPEKLQTKLNKCSTLPSAPGAVFEILELCNDQDISIGKVAKILTRDPALSAKTLTVANSPLFGVRTQVTTVDRAVALLGINATLSFALSYVLVRSLRGLRKASFDHQMFWRRSAIAAVAARSLGSLTSGTPPEELFLAGLLQDIGMLALNESVPDIYRHLDEIGNWNHAAVVDTEVKAVGIDHSAVSAWLLRRWNLPEKLWLAAGGSHDPQVTGEKEQALVRTTALASSVAEIWMHQENSQAAATARMKSESLFQMPVKAFEAKLRDIAGALPEATRNLDIDLGGEEKVFQMFEQAREAIINMTLQMQRQTRDLEKKTHKDQLTSLHNRAFLDETLPSLFERSLKSGKALSVIFADLDHFKKINDAYGHSAGDQVLISVAELMQISLRGDDMIARYGGEEFVCLLPETEAPEAVAVAERLRQAIAGHPIVLDGGRRINITISAGCATMSEKRAFSSVGDLLNAADQCLYAAKESGRNRVISLD